MGADGVRMRWWWVSLAGLVLTAALVFFLWHWAGHLVRQRLLARGFVSDLHGLGFSLGDVSFARLELRRGGVVIFLEQVSVEASPWDVALHGASAVRAVSWSGGHGHVRDGEGELLAWQGGSGRITRRRMSLRFRHVHVSGLGELPEVRLVADLPRRCVARVSSASGDLKVDDGVVLDLRRRVGAVARGVRAGVFGKVGVSRHARSRQGVGSQDRDGPLCRGALLRVTDYHVESVRWDGVMDQVDASLVSCGRDCWRLRGRGRHLGEPQHVDLRFFPMQLRVEGVVRVRALPVSVISGLLPKIPWHAPGQTRLTGELALTSKGGLIRWGLSVVVESLSLLSPKLSPIPIQFANMELDAEGTWDGARRAVRVHAVQGRMGRIRVQGQLEFRAGRHWVLQGDLELPPVSCASFLSSVPRTLFGELATAEVEGEVTGYMGVQIHSRRFDDLSLNVRVSEACEVLSYPEEYSVSRLRNPFLHRVYDGQQLVDEFWTGPGTERWVSIHDVSPFLVHAVLAHEDGGFFSHRGFSVRGIRDALAKDLKQGHFAYGGSTISMQLAKNLFLTREKVLERKLREVLLTWWLEHRLTKRELFELYLNVIEYGPGLYGIGPATRHYFGVHPWQLSPAQGAFLATILPSPKRFHRAWEEGALSPSLRGRMSRLLKHMGERGRFDDLTTRHGLDEVQDFQFSMGRPTDIPWRGRTRDLPWLVREPRGMDLVPEDGSEDFVGTTLLGPP